MMWRIRYCSAIFVCFTLILVSTHSIATETTNAEPSFGPNSIPNIYTQSSVNETAAYGPPFVVFVNWGWTGNLTYTYWDLNGDKGIPNANVTCLSFVCDGIYDLGNGSYLVKVNTTYSWAPEYLYLIVAFDKTGFENQVVVTEMHLYPAPTNLVVVIPEENQIDNYPLWLMIPLGDAIDIQFFYNDTDDSDGHVGGLAGASASATIVGPTLTEQYVQLTDQENGYYNLTFDTTSEWLYESVGCTPRSNWLPYYIHIQLALENRVPWDRTIEITIIDIPTEIQITPHYEPLYPLHLIPSGNFIFVSLVDIWPSHEEALVRDVSISVETYNSSFIEVRSITEDPENPGVYEIVLFNNVPASVQATIPNGGCIPNEITYASIVFSIFVEKEGYASQEITIAADLIAVGGGGWGPQPLAGVPILIVIAVIVGAHYFRKQRQLHSTVASTEID
ncbi:MAG: hypothetical protein OEV85_06330 [Candidatus Thorarchaeota archaeon]|nr:hypothetical protein [Candidatus Thorarchaeota archaeon]